MHVSDLRIVPVGGIFLLHSLFHSCYFLPIEQTFFPFLFFLSHFFVHGAGPRL